VDEDDHRRRPTDGSNGADDDPLEMDPDQGEDPKSMPEAVEEDAVGAGDEDQDDEFDPDESGDPAGVRISKYILDPTKFSLLAESEIGSEAKYCDEPEIRSVVFEHSEPVLA
jgi:hypothetical protein